MQVVDQERDLTDLKICKLFSENYRNSPLQEGAKTLKIIKCRYLHFQDGRMDCQLEFCLHKVSSHLNRVSPRAKKSQTLNLGIAITLK